MLDNKLKHHSFKNRKNKSLTKGQELIKYSHLSFLW